MTNWLIVLYLPIFLGMLTLLNLNNAQNSNQIPTFVFGYLSGIGMLLSVQWSKIIQKKRK